MKNKKLSIGLISLLVFNLYGASKVGGAGKSMTTFQPSSPGLNSAKEAQIKAKIAEARTMFPLSKKAAALREAKDAAAAKAAEEARVLSKPEQNSVKKLVGSALEAGVRAERSQNKPDELIARELNAISSSLKGGSLTDEAAAKVLQLRDQVAFRSDIKNKDYEKTLNAWVAQAEAQLAGKLNKSAGALKEKPAPNPRVGAAAKGVYGKNPSIPPVPTLIFKDGKFSVPSNSSVSSSVQASGSKAPSTQKVELLQQNSGRPAFLSQIEAGNFNLKQTKSFEKPTNSRDELLQSIKTGVTLKPVVKKHIDKKETLGANKQAQLVLGDTKVQSQALTMLKEMLKDPDVTPAQREKMIAEHNSTASDKYKYVDETW